MWCWGAWELECFSAQSCRRWHCWEHLQLVMVEITSPGHWYPAQIWSPCAWQRWQQHSLPFRLTPCTGASSGGRSLGPLPMSSMGLSSIPHSGFTHLAWAFTQRMQRGCQGHHSWLPLWTSLHPPWAGFEANLPLKPPCLSLATACNGKVVAGAAPGWGLHAWCLVHGWHLQTVPSGSMSAFTAKGNRANKVILEIVCSCNCSFTCLRVKANKLHLQLHEGCVLRASALP